MVRRGNQGWKDLAVMDDDHGQVRHQDHVTGRIVVFAIQRDAAHLFREFNRQLAVGHRAFGYDQGEVPFSPTRERGGTASGDPPERP